MGIDDDCGVMAELALSATSLAGFEQQCFSYLAPLIGFDTACSVWSGHDGLVRHVSGAGYREATLSRDFPRYMIELTRDELLRFAGEHPVLDVDVVTPKRRDRLAVYRELLDPAGVNGFVTQVWHAQHGVFGFHFGRTGRTRPFRAAQLRRLDRVAPVMRLGQALLASAMQAEPATSCASDWWSTAWSLSERERSTAALVARGLRNAEIAKLLRISPNTIRNHLSSIFRKAEVSTRSELVFAMLSGAPDGSASPGPVRSRPWSAPLTARSTPLDSRR